LRVKAPKKARRFRWVGDRLDARINAELVAGKAAFVPIQDPSGMVIHRQDLTVIADAFE
jgi:hypothetical protein